MNLRKIFLRNKSRSEQNIICDVRTKEWITHWAKAGRWKFKDFATFAELVDLQTPIQLSMLNNTEGVILCITAFNEEATISLHAGNNDYSVIAVTKGEKTKVYLADFNNRIRTAKPQIRIRDTTVRKNGRELIYSYNRSYSLMCWELILNETDEIRIEIAKVKECEETSQEVKNLANFLLNLNEMQNESQVCETIVEFLDLATEAVEDDRSILILYTNDMGVNVWNFDI